MASAVDTVTAAPVFLRDRSFDATFIGGVAAIALACGAIVTAEPRLFAPILLLDLWLLGYHHVVSTYTRLCFDRTSFREHRFLVIWLPPVILAAVASAAYAVGVWIVSTAYLYWQWFHYSRQSYGIAQVYQRKAAVAAPRFARLELLAFYALPAWGILHRSHQNHPTFLGAELRMLPVPGAFVDAVGAAALLVLVGWLLARLDAWWRGELPVVQTLYVLSHHVLFGVGYLLIGDLDHGWLVLNVWHNAQYILFVWLFNVRRFDRRPDPARFLSWISQQRNAPLYFAVCLGISTALYAGVAAAFASATALVVVYQALNFHHYVVDANIWKVGRTSRLRQTLGLPA